VGAIIERGEKGLRWFDASDAVCFVPLSLTSGLAGTALKRD